MSSRGGPEQASAKPRGSLSHPPSIPQHGATTRGGKGRPTAAASAAAAAAASAGVRGRVRWSTPKRVIYTGAFAAVTVVGAIYGAGIKAQQEYAREKQQVLEAPTEERVRDLEARRARLVTQRWPLERKLEELRARVLQEEQAQTQAQEQKK